MVLYTGFYACRANAEHLEIIPATTMIRILLVDDEPLFLQASKPFLEKDPEISCETCESSAAALELLSSPDFDAVVSDYDMPGMDGIALLKAVRDLDSDLPFILLTGRGREEVVIEALNHGADFYLQKNTDPRVLYTELLTKIRHAVDRRRSREALRKSEENFRLALQHSPTVFFHQDRDLRYTWVLNPHPAFSSEDQLGKTDTDLFPPDDAAALTAVKRRVLETGKGARETIRVTIEGTPHYYDLTAEPLRDDKGRIIGVQCASHEITAQKQVEQSLKESREQYCQLVRQSPCGIVIHSEGRVLFCNRVAAGILGAEDEREITGRPVLELVHPDYQDIAARRITHIQDGEQQIAPNIEERFIRLDGSAVDVEVTGGPVTFAGKPAVQVVFHDITERKKMEKALRASEEKYRRFFEEDLTGDFVSTAEGTILDCNRAFARIFGFGSVDEARGASIVDTYPSAADRLRLLPLLMEQGKLENFRTTRRRRDGSSISVVQNAVGRFDAQGKLEEIWGYLYDDSERSEAEEELKRSEETLRALVDAIPESALLIERDGTILAANEVIGQRIGMPVNDLIGKPFGDVFPQEVAASRKEQLESVIASGEPRMFEDVRGDRNIANYLYPILDGQGRVVRMAFLGIDITHRKEIEHSLREANRKLTLLGRITRHDILNQITGMYGMISLIQEDIPDNARAKKYFAYLSEAAKTIHRHIDFTEDFFHMGEKPPEWQNVGHVLGQASAHAHLESVRISVDLEPIEVFADPMLERAFYNLFDNSVEHGERVSNIAVSFGEEDGQGVLVIEDDGIGIAAGAKEAIFHQSFGRNSGYGLFLVREILDLTGIAIRETGREGRGARFEIRIPPGKWRAAEEMPPK